MSENICRFVSTRKSDEVINIINLVYEKEAEFKKEYIISATYSLAVVTEGKGVLHTTFGDFELVRGNHFMTFSAKPYYIENVEGLKYIYITFVGQRIPAIIERISLSPSNPVFSGYEETVEKWIQNFSRATNDNVDLLCEGMLLEAFSSLCRKKEEVKYLDKTNSILQLKQYVDTHFTDSELNLANLSRKFSYNSKYISTAFKKMVHSNFSTYLADRRLEHAVSLIDSGITNVKELSDMCGYSDPMYFSKAFKQKYGTSPKKFISSR